MESTLFVPAKWTFSENLRCLNLPLLVGAVSQKRSLSLTCFVFAGQNVHSGKFKHLKFSENDKFSGTNSIDSILENYLNRFYGALIYLCAQAAAPELARIYLLDSMQTRMSSHAQKSNTLPTTYIIFWH